MNCNWIRQNDSKKGWFIAESHPEADMEPQSNMTIWLYCPYCGKPITHFKQKPKKDG
jgi:hypothetical protein